MSVSWGREVGRVDFCPCKSDSGKLLFIMAALICTDIERTYSLTLSVMTLCQQKRLAWKANHMSEIFNIVLTFFSAKCLQYENTINWSLKESTLYLCHVQSLLLGLLLQQIHRPHRRNVCNDVILTIVFHSFLITWQKNVENLTQPLAFCNHCDIFRVLP